MVAAEYAHGSFTLNIESIRLHDGQLCPRGGEQSARPRKVRALLRVKSSITASFFYPDDSRVRRTRSTEAATLKADGRARDGKASIDMEPIVIEHDRLVPSPSRMITGKSYKMEVRLAFTTMNDAEDFYEYMGVTNVAGNPLQLFTLYDDILRCPTGRTVLQLQDHTKKLVFDLEVCMWWTNAASESILERSNRALRSREEHSRSYITPPLDMDRKPKFQITYSFGSRVIHKSSLACPLDGCRVRRSTDIKDLQMHLDTFHDHFRFTAFQKEVDRHGVEHWTFEGEIADHRADQRASDRADEPMDVRVYAPEYPFDRNLHLLGNTKFHQAATQRNPPRHTGLKGKRISSTQRTAMRKPPEEVRDRPPRPKKTYVVPPAPRGITFFRSLTKQPLQAGDEISESDDELDDQWMELRQKAEINKEDIPEAAKGFQLKFDYFMRNENVQADLHASDAIVRFVRDNNRWLSQHDVFLELASKLDELLVDGIIFKDTHTACLEIVRSPRIGNQTTDEILQQLTQLQVGSQEMELRSAGHKANRQSQSRRDRKGKGKAKLTDMGHLTPITADSDGDLEMREATLNGDATTQPPGPVSKTQPVFDECYCGEDALSSISASPVIACNKADCIRRHFHIQCVQDHARRPLPPLNPRKRDWTCDDCKKLSKTHAYTSPT
ncbi:hypothetical protein NX059_001598 [Plenodomus lindquistii]|nr:hypothetical protein NX059_001598 [Plenodomus lindquistii]